jgi:hypothetical protein
MTLEQAARIAEATWQGVYRIERSSDGFFKVILHSANGPVHWLHEDSERA